MAYTAIPTKNAGDLLTAALWNTYLQGNAASGFMRMIADNTLSGNAANVDFTSLPQTFAHLFIILQARGDTGATSTQLSLRFNNDSGANYDVGAGIGGTVSGGATSGAIGPVSASTAPANSFGAYVLWIPHYAQANTFKACQTLGFVPTAAGGVNLAAYSQQILWKITPVAINQITFIPGAGNLVQYSRFTIYGLPA